MASLFTPLIQRLHLLDLIAEAEGELTPELEERLAVSDERISETTQYLLELRETCQTQLLGIDAEIARLQQAKKRIANTEAVINNQLLEAAKRLGAIYAGTYVVSTRPSTAVEVDDDAVIPHEYCKHIPAVAESWKPDKTALGKALRAGAVIEGATLEHRTNLVIK